MQPNFSFTFVNLSQLRRLALISNLTKFALKFFMLENLSLAVLSWVEHCVSEVEVVVFVLDVVHCLFEYWWWWWAFLSDWLVSGFTAAASQSKLLSETRKLDHISISERFMLRAFSSAWGGVVDTCRCLFRFRHIMISLHQYMIEEVLSVVHLDCFPVIYTVSASFHYNSVEKQTVFSQLTA